jgi:hypothetical protein
MSLPYSAHTSTALAAGMIIRARTPSLIMQGAVQVTIQAIRRRAAAGGLFDIIARITTFCAKTHDARVYGACRAAHTQPCMH